MRLAGPRFWSPSTPAALRAWAATSNRARPAAPPTQADQVHIADRRPGQHRARERRRDVQVVRRSCPGRELEFGGFEPDHAEGDRRTVGFGGAPVALLYRRCLRRRVERDLDHGPEVHSVSCWRVNDASTWSGADGSGKWPETSLKGDRALGRRDEDAEVGRVDRVGAVARRLTVVRADHLDDRADSGKLGELRHRSDGVHVGVEAMGGDELRERGLRTTTGRGRGQHDPANDADQERDGQPGSPPAAHSARNTSLTAPKAFSSRSTCVLHCLAEWVGPARWVTPEKWSY